MMKNKWTRRLCAAAVCTLMLTNALAEEAPALLEPAGVRLASVKARVGDMQKISVYAGQVIPYVQEMYFEIEGEIGEVCVTVGQTVKKGDVLLTINQEQQLRRRQQLQEEISALETDMSYDEALAQIDLEILNHQLERLSGQLPRDDRAIALKQLEIEQFGLDTALQAELSALKLSGLRDELESLLAEAERATMTAPFDGRVMFIEPLHAGSRVGAYSPLIYLADDSRLYVESEYISETTLGLAHSLYALVDGSTVQITPQPPDAAQILAKTVSGEALTTRFDLQPGTETTAGEYAAVCLETAPIEDVLIVPTNTLYTAAGSRYVYVLENGARVRRDVKTGASNNVDTQILEGLSEGEEVYVPD